jgi:Ca2+-binding EF-hand superfamily protein
MRPPPPKEMFQRADEDSDGVVNASELEKMVAQGPADGASASELLDQYDTNGDGALSLEEMTAMLDAHRAEMEASRPNSQFPMGDLLSLLQSDQGKQILQGIVSDLFAQFQSGGALAGNAGTSSIDLMG